MARKRQPKRAGVSTRHGRKRGEQSPRLPISRAIREHSRSVDKIGRKNIQRGPHKIGSTGFITPTKRGFNVAKELIREIRGVKQPSTFTYGLRIQLPSGKTKTITPRANIIPRHRREKKLAEKAKRAKSQSARTRAVHELFMERVRSEVFANRIKISKAQSEAYRQLRTKSKKKARTYLAKIQQKKGIKFAIEIYREI